MINCLNQGTNYYTRTLKEIHNIEGQTDKLNFFTERYDYLINLFKRELVQIAEGTSLCKTDKDCESCTLRVNDNTYNYITYRNMELIFAYLYKCQVRDNKHLTHPNGKFLSADISKELFTKVFDHFKLDHNTNFTKNQGVDGKKGMINGQVLDMNIEKHKDFIRIQKEVKDNFFEKNVLLYHTNFRGEEYIPNGDTLQSLVHYIQNGKM